MPISVTCGGCRKPYQVKDELVGKKIRCPKCSEVIAVRKQQPDEEYEDYGDPADEADDEEDESPRRAPKVKLSDGKQKKKKRKASFMERFNPLWMLVPFLIVATIGSGVAIYVFPPLARVLGFGIMGMGVLLGAIGAVQCRSAAYEEDTAAGMMFYLVPGYAFYYIFSRWSYLMPYSATWLMGVLMLFGGIGIERAGVAWDTTSQVNQLEQENAKKAAEFSQNIEDSKRRKLMRPTIPPRPAGPDTRQQITADWEQLEQWSKPIPAGHRLSVGDLVLFLQSSQSQGLVSEVVAVEGADRVKVHIIGMSDAADAVLTYNWLRLMNP